MKEFIFSQIVGIEAENIDDAWEIFNSTSRDNWDVEEKANSI